jgi:hypothetical protein
MQPRVKIWISIALLGTVACGDDGSPPADDAASSSTTDPGTTTMIADVPGECDHVPLSDDPVVDMYAEHLMAVVSVHEAAQARIDGARAMLAEAFALPADATIDDVMAAFSASVGEMTGDARLAWSDALMCADTLEAARAAARDCDAATSGDSPVVCRGVCIQPDPRLRERGLRGRVRGLVRRHVRGRGGRLHGRVPRRVLAAVQRDRGRRVCRMVHGRLHRHVRVGHDGLLRHVQRCVLPPAR